MLAAVFAGDRRVWRAAALVAAPALALVVAYCVRPRFYFTGTDSVSAYAYLAPTPADTAVCIPDLQLPAGTAFVRLRVLSPTQERPAMALVLHIGGRAIRSRIAPLHAPPDRITNADFPIPPRPASPASRRVSLCASAKGPLEWAGVPLSKPGGTPPTIKREPVSARIAVWYLPATGSRRSYAQASGAIFARAALFRPGIVGAWTYPVLLFVVLPLTALLALRCLALAAAGRGRRLGAWLYAVAAINGCCWALVTPVFQGPDEVDHFAYTQSVVERGVAPVNDQDSPLLRWSGAENRALEDSGFFTDHQLSDTRPPWLAVEERHYFAQVRDRGAPADDGGGYETSASAGPLYYLALAPAYLATRAGSIFSQLTLMRMSSALIGALTVLFAFLLVRELAPGRLWLAVLAALLVAYEPMYGFISGVVNNDVGVDACAAALELLLIRMLRRGLDVRWGALTGAVLIALPIFKGTGLELYPVAALALAAALWRHHTRRDLYGLAGVGLGVVAMELVSAHVLHLLQPPASASGASVVSSNASAVSAALHHIPGYLSYLWQALLPRLPFMAPRFPPSAPGFVLFTDPAFVIWVERGWAAFGWYDVLFRKWVYIAIFLTMVAFVPLGAWAARREWAWVRRHWIEVALLIAVPVVVILGVEAAYYTPGQRTAIAEFGRYAFPAIVPLAALVVGALHAFSRRRMLTVGAGLATLFIVFGFASQVLTLTSYYA